MNEQQNDQTKTQKPQGFTVGADDTKKDIKQASDASGTTKDVKDGKDKLSGGSCGCN